MTEENAEEPNAAESAEEPNAAEINDKTSDKVWDAGELETLTDRMIAAIKTVYDPEIPVDIYELGLIYRIDVSDDMDIEVDMTLTAPGCPVAGEMPGWVEDAIRTVEGVRDVKVKLVFHPFWEPSRMSEAAKVALNMF